MILATSVQRRFTSSSVPMPSSTRPVFRGCLGGAWELAHVVGEQLSRSLEHGLFQSLDNEAELGIRRNAVELTVDTVKQDPHSWSRCLERGWHQIHPIEAADGDVLTGASPPAIKSSAKDCSIWRMFGGAATAPALLESRGNTGQSHKIPRSADSEPGDLR